MYAEFIKGINSKTKDSWKKLYCHYYSALCNYSHKITGDKSASEDIVQTIFIKIWEKKVIFENINGLTAYLYKSTYTHSLNHLRDNKKNFPINSALQNTTLTSSEDDYIKMALDEEIISLFYSTLEKMTPRQREVLLRTMKGDKIESIAIKMEISVNSVKTHKKRAYQFLRDNLGDNFFILFLLYYSRFMSL